MYGLYEQVFRCRGTSVSAGLFLLLLGMGLSSLAQAQPVDYTQARYSGAEAGEWGGAQGAVNGPADNSCAGMGAVGKVNLTSGYGFTIPGGSTITAVTAFVRGGEQSEQIVGVQLASNAASEPATLLGSQKDLTIAGVGNGSCNSSVLNSLGGNLAFWGTNTTAVNPTVVNNGNFGLVFTKKEISSVKVDSVCLEITYTHGQTENVQQSCSDDPEPPPVEANSGRATFTVQKTFADGNEQQDVTINIQCFTGLPLNQSQTVSPDNGGEFEVEFVVESFDQGQLDCDIWEEEVPGYSPSYDASSVFADTSEDDDGCHFDNVDTINAGDTDVQNLCEIVNTPDPVEVEVHKVWLIEGSDGADVDQDYELILTCNNPILGENELDGFWSADFSGTGNSSAGEHTVAVVPDWEGGTSCSVQETVFDDAVESSDDCSGLDVDVADVSVSCTVTNTVFFEGIPTLNQYGMAVLALLLLGVGFAGFRRFV